MDVKEKVKNVSPPIAGDGGEAVSEGHNIVVPSLLVEQSEPVERQQVIPDDAGWYVAVVRCNCENAIGKSIFDEFKSRSVWFEYWVPMRKEMVIDKRTNKRRKKEKVLLTTFVFCHVGASRLNDIRFRPDVYKMLTLPGRSEIYRIRDRELDDYRRLLENPDMPASPCSGPLKKGQRVRITEGHMAGLEAYVQRISGRRAVIGNEIKYISGATIEIDRSFLEVVAED